VFIMVVSLSGTTGAASGAVDLIGE
jgi:hypothetical protein